MIRERFVLLRKTVTEWLKVLQQRDALSLTVVLSVFIGILAGLGAALFTVLIETVGQYTVGATLALRELHGGWQALLCLWPAIGLLVVAWFTRRFAPEAQGHGVPEVIVAVARKDGVIRPRVSLVKILASGICIGTGGSVGREGPIVQIGASLGSVAGQFFRLSSRNIKVLVAAGAAAGISATFNAPLAGVIFAGEIILGSFAVQSLAPIVIASVVADVVQTHVGEHGLDPAFLYLHYEFVGAWEELPAYFILGLVCGLAAVWFTRVVYAIEDLGQKLLPRWWARAIVFGGIVGVVGACYPSHPPIVSQASADARLAGHQSLPPLFGVGYEVVDHALHLEFDPNAAGPFDPVDPKQSAMEQGRAANGVFLGSADLLREFWWLLPLVFLKPLLTSLTLAGGGSGGVFAPSLFIGATTGACFGLLCNRFIPGVSANPGVYAIVGMGAVVAGTTQGVLSAILIVYEMTNDYRIILPIMIAAGLASAIARFVDPESIYHKKLSRRKESIARSHEMHGLEHIMVRDVMVRQFPTVNHTDDVSEIIRVARANPTIESLPVLNEVGKLAGIIRPEDLHRVLDSDLPPQLLKADDVALVAPLSVAPDQNLLEALRDFGSRDIETLPVEIGSGSSRKLIGLLLRSDVMRRYRQEMLSSY
ncbi:MAG: chloride channel protein [Pirellulaceae bacterium]|jgi:CIC family chloride channel protein|nr:chloride channel protein [Pirellulaceae bacterium]MDP6556027.1 chloride channel protein [Pirellulaceae bacterium]